MNVLVNTGNRRLGIPGRPAIILNPHEAVEVTEEQLDDMKRNRTVARWLGSGVLTVRDAKDHEAKPQLPPRRSSGVTRKPSKVDRDKREPIVLPEGVEEQGVFKHHTGGGWWDVYVNGFKVTDTKVRKDEAEQLMSEYE